jgi:hypothetical protein
MEFWAVTLKQNNNRKKEIIGFEDSIFIRGAGFVIQRLQLTFDYFVAGNFI